MSTESNPVSLRDFFVEKLEALARTTELSRSALERNVETARAALAQNTETARSALEKNLDLSRVALEKRLDTMNEFRDSLKDQAATFLTRAEMQLILIKIEADIRVLREAKASTEGGASRTSVNVATIIAVIAALAAVAALFLHH